MHLRWSITNPYLIFDGGPEMAPKPPNDSSQARLGRRTACGFALPRAPGDPWRSSMSHIASASSHIPVNPLFDGTNSKAGDEAIEKEIVDDGDGDAGDEAGGHQRAPVVDVAAYQG